MWRVSWYLAELAKISQDYEDPVNLRDLQRNDYLLPIAYGIVITKYWSCFFFWKCILFLQDWEGGLIFSELKSYPLKIKYGRH